MANTLGEIKDEVLVELGASTTLAYYTDTILKNWIDKAHKWAGGKHKWPFTEGRVSTTFASLVTDEDSMLRGEYPEGWKSDSIRQLRIQGKTVQKLNYRDFYGYLEENADVSGEQSRIFTDFGRSYFVNPNIDLSGTVSVWGQFTPLDLDGTNPNATTVFSPTEEGNEAIVEKVLSYAMIREKKIPEARDHNDSAVELLEGLWESIRGEQFGYHTKRRGMWERINIITGLDSDDQINEDRF